MQHCFDDNLSVLINKLERHILGRHNLDFIFVSNQYFTINKFFTHSYSNFLKFQSLGRPADCNAIFSMKK